MADAGFSVYARQRKAKKSIYYARFKTEKGWTTGKNTGCTSREAAERWALEQIETGKIQLPGGPVPTLDGWAAGFFGVDGRYDKAKKARGRELSQTYVKNLDRHYNKYLSPAFGKKRIDQITPLELEQFFLNLYNREKDPISGSTVNGVLRAARALFSEAERLEVIYRNPAARVGRFAEKSRTRGTLTQSELDKLFALDALHNVWSGERLPYLISMIAVGCGLRHGEVVALRPSDFVAGVVVVSRSYDKASGAFKAPKWNSIREMPAPERITEEVECYAAEKGIGPNDLLFPSSETTRPIAAHIVLDSLRDAMEVIEISREAQKRENRFLDLHSLRHTYVSRLRAGDVPDWQIMRAAGHKSLKMTDHYTHTTGEELGAIKQAQILPFKKRA